jgi:alpha-beta hydrolase superfamily lysophospholipase
MMQTVRSSWGMHLDDRERHFFVSCPRSGLRLFLRHLAPTRARFGDRRAVLYVHGATFPSALSIAHRFEGRSWRDELCEAGFHVWGLDFLGYGGSDRYPEMDEPPESHAPLGTAEEATEQIIAAVRFILEQEQLPRISVIAHSWGALPAVRFASSRPSWIDRLALFAPIVSRAPKSTDSIVPLPAWRTVNLHDQWTRFTEDVPANESPVLSRIHFAEWGERYLDSAVGSRTRTPPSVKVPSGPYLDICRAWSGRWRYDPAKVRAPVCILRGEWDRVTTREDSRVLFEGLTATPLKREITLSRGTHLMHLESGRHALHRESACFLLGEE